MNKNKNIAKIKKWGHDGSGIHIKFEVTKYPLSYTNLQNCHYQY